MPRGSLCNNKWPCFLLKRCGFTFEKGPSEYPEISLFQPIFLAMDRFLLPAVGYFAPVVEQSDFKSKSTVPEDAVTSTDSFESLS